MQSWPYRKRIFLVSLHSCILFHSELIWTFLEIVLHPKLIYPKNLLQNISPENCAVYIPCGIIVHTKTIDSNLQ